MFFPLYDENPTKSPAVVTVAIIVVNFVCLIYTQNLDRTQGELAKNAFVFRYGFIPARLGQIIDGKPIQVDIGPKRVVQQGRQRFLVGEQRMVVLQPSVLATALSAVSSMFLHGNWYHLLSNMWFFWIFGNNIEDRLGHGVFLLFYLLGGLIATGCHAVMTGENGSLVPVIGASGAVAVTLGAYAIFYPWANVRSLLFIVVFFTFVDVPALVVLGIWFISQLASGVDQLRFDAGTGVAWWAHIGGFVAGAALMPLVARREPEKEALAWHHHDPPRFRG